MPQIESEKLMTEETKEQTPLHILELRAENVKRLKAVTIKPDGNFVIIGGENAQGKTSILDAIEMTLKGAKTIPPEPIHRGKRRANTFIDLGEITVERKFDVKKGSWIEVRDKNGEKMSSPQTLLDKLFSSISFDPLEFARADPSKQDITLRNVMGIDFTELDAQRKVAYDERRDLNRDLKAKETLLANSALHEDVPAEEIKMEDLTKKLDAFQKEHAEWKKKTERQKELDDFTVESMTNLKSHREEREQLEKRLAEMHKEETELEQAVKDAEKAAIEYQNEVGELVEPSDEDIREEMKTADATNRKVRENADHIRLRDETRELAKKIEECNDTIQDVDDEKARILSEAKFPIPGLGFDETGPTMNGVPLEQASHAERLQVSVAIGAALNPRLRIILIREAAYLDENAMRMLAEFARDHDYQFWLERVGTKDESAIIIEDGTVVEEATAE